MHNSPPFGLFMNQNAYVPVGKNEGGGRATRTSISIFDSYVMRPCDLNLVMISALASKCQDFKFGMPVFQPFYEMKLKTSKFKVLAF